MVDIIITALISALFSAYLTAKIQRYFDNKKEQEKIFFDIYMKLMEFEGYYFWLSSDDQVTKNKESKEILDKVWRLKWEIADMSRKLQTKELQKILETLFLKNLNYQKRYNELTDLISELGNKINPRYRAVMKKISDENIKSIKNKYGI